MTTIVATHELIAGDTCLNTGNGAAPMSKIVRIRGSLWGFAGSSTDALKFLRWVKGGCRPTTKPDFVGVKGAKFDAIQVTPEGRIVLWDQDLEPLPLRRKYHAIGSGGDFALGSLVRDRKSGRELSAIGALEVAAESDMNTRAPFDILYLDPKRKDATRP